MKKQIFATLILTLGLCSGVVLTAQNATRDTTTGSSEIDRVPGVHGVEGVQGLHNNVPVNNAGDAGDLSDVNIDDIDPEILEKIQNATAAESMLPAWVSDALESGTAKILSLPGVTPALLFILELPGVLPVILFLRDNAKPVVLTATALTTILLARKCLHRAHA